MTLIGYAVTISMLTSLVILCASLIKSRKALLRRESGTRARKSTGILLAIIVFFLFFSLFFVSATEQLYFDENIYQGIAVNILSHGNALWCQIGTGYLKGCYSNSLYHDPVGWSVIIALAFMLFGISTQTAFALQLAVGVFAIALTFGLAQHVYGNIRTSLTAALIFALSPILIIWSRTQAAPDLPFMMLSTASFLLFFLAIEKRNAWVTAAFLAALIMTAYTRSEAILLLPIFAFLWLTYPSGRRTKDRIGELCGSLAVKKLNLAIAILFILLIYPELLYVFRLAVNPHYGQNEAGTQLFSYSSLVNNGSTNLKFLLGGFNQISFYPALFLGTLTIFAVAGAAYAIILRRRDDLWKPLGISVWVLAYFFFYSSFYAGSATYGVDSRFMLELLPGICIMGAYGFSSLSNSLGSMYAKALQTQKKKTISNIMLCSLLMLGAIVPFYMLIPLVTLPPSRMPQQSLIYPAMQFFYKNYDTVSTRCMVFSFTPEIWYDVNRSSAQVSYANSISPETQSYMSNYTCFVFDYGYWCNTPPYDNTLCRGYNSSDGWKTLAYNTSNGHVFGLYEFNTTK